MVKEQDAVCEERKHERRRDGDHAVAEPAVGDPDDELAVAQVRPGIAAVLAHPRRLWRASLVQLLVFTKLGDQVGRGEVRTRLPYQHLFGSAHAPLQPTVSLGW